MKTIGKRAIGGVARRKRSPWYRLIYLPVALYLFFVLFPVYWILATSLKTELDVISMVPKFFNFNATLDSYRAVLGFTANRQVDFLAFFKNSLIVVPSAVALAMILGIPAAYAMARFRFKLRENLYFFYLSQYFLPPILVLVPLYLIYRRLHLYNTYMGLVLILQLINLPLVILILRGFFEEVPVEIEEAAMIDGANLWQVLTRVTLPIAKAGLMATAFLTAIFSWNNFLFGLVLSGTSKMPVTVGMLSFQSYEKVLWNQMAAASIISLLPPLILGIAVQRYLVRGLSLGAMKE
ncbi:MAG: carbohydrate ABC transporter permease [Actinobacteria bacterium]|nr:carbohydrate ABC transporter permease [Actinomycetota bacterium]